MNLFNKIKADEEIILFKHNGKHYELRKDKEKVELKDITKKGGEKKHG